MRQCKKLIARNDEANAIGSRIQISSRPSKNLLRIAAGYKDGQGVTKTPQDEDAGCFKCNHCIVSCPIIEETKPLKEQTLGKFTKLGNILTATVIVLFICLHEKSVKANM